MHRRKRKGLKNEFSYRRQNSSRHRASGATCRHCVNGYRFLTKGQNMKTTVYLNEFRDYFQKIRPDNFSYEGLGALFEYLEECERDTGENYELDVIALCCDFSEDTPEAIAESYSIEISDCGGDYYEISAKVKEYLEDENYLIGEVSGGFVYRQH